jgi:hypothetical protein
MNQGIAGVSATVASELKRLLVEFDLVDVVKNNLGVEPFGVGLEALHQVRPHDTLHIGRPVVHFGGGHQLTTLGHAGDEQGFEVGSGGVNGGSEASRA